jgi:hypothetical protein
MVMLMPPHFVNGLFNVFRPDIGCIASTSFSAQMAVMMEEVKKNRVSGYRAPSRSPTPRRGTNRDATM